MEGTRILAVDIILITFVVSLFVSLITCWTYPLLQSEINKNLPLEKRIYHDEVLVAFYLGFFYFFIIYKIIAFLFRILGKSIANIILRKEKTEEDFINHLIDKEQK